MVTVHVAAHPVFSLDGENVKVTAPVTFTEAVFRRRRLTSPTPDGGTVRLKVAPGTPSGRVLRVKGRGIKGPKHVGDLLVTVQVAVPQRVAGAAKEALEEFATATKGEDPRADLIARARRADAS